MELEDEAARLAKRPVAFKRLTGLSVPQFIDLLERPLCDRLLMTLIYYRTYISQEFSGYLFDLDDANVCRNMARIRPVLAQIFRVPEKRLKVDPEEVATLFLMARNNGSTGLRAA